jgi:hypothetical protein
MKALFRHMAQAELLSRTKEYTNALKEIDGMLMKRIATIAKVGYITRCILSGEEIQRQKEIEQGLAAKRAAMVGEARAWAEEHRPKGKTGKRRKRKTDDAAPGEDTGIESQGRPAKGATYATTYVLVKEGLTLEQIAQKRQMAKSTIEGHIARGIAEGEIGIEGLMPDSERDLIADWMRENPSKGLNEAAGYFEGRFGYGQLRMVQAWVKREAAEG